ncbi:MAG: purine-nucleoside phosphorylase [Ruminococcus sp.]|nr:purine-nucleoside phosphorylase [Ruminococcus sp.]
MSTPHNAARKGDIAKTVLMPGDPLRAKFIAETYLEQPVCYNTVRNMLGYTGLYKGIPVSVQGSGMGMPSMGIYSYELFHEYDVDRIIRIGTAGGVCDDIKLRDVVMAQAACTNSAYASQYGLPGTYAPIADFSLLETAVKAARELNIAVRVGNILSSDIFYYSGESDLPRWAKMGILATEMEAAALYMNAAEAGKQALCIATISDCPLRGEALSAEERQYTFSQMMEIALETCTFF